MKPVQFSHAIPTPTPERLGTSTQAQVLRPVLLAFGVVLVIFVTYEVVERLWLKDAAVDSLYLAHLARGLIASLVAASVAGWLMVRVEAPLRATTPSADAWADGIRPIEEERIASYLLWLIVLRWVAVIVTAGLAVVIRMAGIIPPEAGGYLAATIVVLALSNVAYAILMRYRRLNRHLLFVQSYADLLLLMGLLHFSGGIENPLSVAMIFHVILAGIVLSRAECYAVAASGALLFALLAWAEGTGLLTHYTLEIFPHVIADGRVTHAAGSSVYVTGHIARQAAILFLVGYFVTTLAERIRYGERQLSALADRALADRQLLEQALESTGTGLSVLDGELKRFWVNERWKSWFGDTPGTRDGPPVWRAAYEPARQTLADGNARVTELTEGEGFRGAGAGDSAPPPAFQITTAALRDRTGSVTHAFALAQEITQQKRAQAQMLRAEKLAAVGELAGRVAHEVNNPVAIISAKARLLLSDRSAEMSQKVGQELTKITELADRVAQIARGLLTYCRPSTAKRESLDIRGPIRRAIALVAQPARQMGIQIEDELMDALPTVCANASEMEQVFLNLLLNALDAMPRGGRLRLFASHEPDGDAGHVSIMVEDTGTGIARGIRERVFEPFFTTKTEGKGTGLGLSVCIGIVRGHGGEIKIDSAPGRGTQVAVTLPADGTGKRRQ